MARVQTVPTYTSAHDVSSVNASHADDPELRGEGALFLGGGDLFSVPVFALKDRRRRRKKSLWWICARERVEEIQHSDSVPGSLTMSDREASDLMSR